MTSSQCEGRDDQNGWYDRKFLMGLDAPRGLNAIDPGQSPVHHHQVERPVGLRALHQHQQCFLAGGNRPGAKAGTEQDGDQSIAFEFAVFDDQDTLSFNSTRPDHGSRQFAGGNPVGRLEAEGAAPARLAFDLNGAAHQLSQLSRDGQAQTGSRRSGA